MLLEVSQNPIKFFAKRLYKSMKGIPGMGVPGCDGMSGVRGDVRGTRGCPGYEGMPGVRGDARGTRGCLECSRHSSRVSDVIIAGLVTSS